MPLPKYTDLVVVSASNQHYATEEVVREYGFIFHRLMMPEGEEEIETAWIRAINFYGDERDDVVPEPAVKGWKLHISIYASDIAIAFDILLTNAKIYDIYTLKFIHPDCIDGLGDEQYGKQFVIHHCDDSVDYQSFINAVTVAFVAHGIRPDCLPVSDKPIRGSVFFAYRNEVNHRAGGGYLPARSAVVVDSISPHNPFDVPDIFKDLTAPVGTLVSPPTSDDEYALRQFSEDRFDALQEEQLTIMSSYRVLFLAYERGEDVSKNDLERIQIQAKQNLLILEAHRVHGELNILLEEIDVGLPEKVISDCYQFIKRGRKASELVSLHFDKDNVPYVRAQLLGVQEGLKAYLVPRLMRFSEEAEPAQVEPCTLAALGLYLLIKTDIHQFSKGLTNGLYVLEDLKRFVRFMKHALPNEVDAFVDLEPILDAVLDQLVEIDAAMYGSSSDDEKVSTPGSESLASLFSGMDPFVSLDAFGEVVPSVTPSSPGAL